MSESRKNHFIIDSGQVNEDDHVSSYKSIKDSDKEFRKSKSSLTKSREKVSSDGAEEKLLQKEDEAKIITRVDMADAKYIVGDHRNGDAKIELDANKKQFSGLTKEELMKYADDPFWVRLRWFMFILFWALWLCMLGGAIAIIIRAPKCDSPRTNTWYEKGPLVDVSSMTDYEQIETELPALQSSNVEGIFAHVCKDTYEVLDDDSCLKQFDNFAKKAKEYGVRVVVDLTVNYVDKAHSWFVQSENRTGGYDDYFIWAKAKGFDEGKPKPPNNWVSTINTSAWHWSDKRREFYLSQFGEPFADLNLTNPSVVRELDAVLTLWMKAGADGVRLHKARHLLVNSSLADEVPRTGKGSELSSDHSQYAYWQHKHTLDLLPLDALLMHLAHVVQHASSTDNTDETVFTLYEEGSLPEFLVLQRGNTFLRPPASRALQADRGAALFAADINARLGHWPAMQLTSGNAAQELVSLALLLPAAPVLALDQLPAADNYTDGVHAFARLVAVREEVSVQHGQYNVSALRTRNSSQPLIACARWKVGHTGYAAVFNPTESMERADLSTLPAVPDDVSVYYVTPQVAQETNYTSNAMIFSRSVVVPAKSSVVVSYVPKTAVEE